MKKISVILFSLLITFSFAMNVKAIGAVGESEVGKPTSSHTINVQNWLPGWNKGENPKITVGFRVSFVKSNGTDLSVKDYVLIPSRYNEMQYAGCHSKPYYATGHAQITMTDTSCLGGTLSDLNAIFSKYHFKTISSNDYLYNNHTENGKSYVYAYSYNLSSSKNWFDESRHYYGDYETDLRGLLKELLKGTSVNIDNDNELKNLFMVVEPTTLVNLQGLQKKKGFYYGTAYELSVLSRNTTETFIKNPSYKTNNVGNALSSFYDLLGRNLPCASYLTGSLLSRTTDVEGFTAGKYFGLLQTDNSCISGGHLPQDKLTGDYGVGMAIVWFYDLFHNVPTCSDVNYYTGVTTKLDRNNWNISSIVNRFNTFYATQKGYSKITYDWYNNNCTKTTTPPTGYDCTPDYYVGTCINNDYSNAVYYKDRGQTGQDDDYWKTCVFEDNGKYTEMGMDHKTASQTANTYYESNLGDSTFCPVYCIEELQANFDNSLPSVKAGYHFTWLTDETTVKGSRTCKTKDYIKNSEFQKLLIAGNKSATVAYAEYVLEKNKAKGLDNEQINNKINDSACSCIYNTTHKSCCESESSFTTITKQVIISCDATVEDCPEGSYSSGKASSCTESYNSNTANGITTITIVNCGVGYECNKINDTHYDSTHYKYDGVSYEYGSLPGSTDSWWCKNETPHTTNVSGKYTAYTNQLDYLENLIKRIENCYNWSNSDKISNFYNINPTLNVSYSDGNSYYYNGKLEEKPGSSYVNTQDTGSKKEEKQKYPTVDSCSDNGNSVTCIKTNKDYKTYEVVEMTATASKSYQLPSGIYPYVTKKDNRSVHTLFEIGDEDYINIGYSNFPVSYKTEDGFHSNAVVEGLTFLSGELNIQYENLGHIKPSSLNYSAINNILSSVSKTKKDYGNWMCGYTVESDIIDRGTIVKYRQIDLKNPFPEIDGSGRRTGNNWCDESNCNNNNLVVKNVITNKQDIYNKTPMYSITLTPKLIKEIRKYNRTTDYADKVLGCDEGTGKNCISPFVTAIIERGQYQGFNFNTETDQSLGTCSFNRSTRVANFFEGCRSAQK